MTSCGPGNSAAAAGRTNIGDYDAFITKWDANGNPGWVHQFGTIGEDYALAVALDAKGAPVVAGETAGLLAGAAPAGGLDGFARQYDPAGNVVWTRQFGSPSDDYAVGTTVGPTGDVFVVGTTLGTLPGQSSKGDTVGDSASSGGSDAFLAAAGPAGALVWVRQFGGSADDYAMALAIGRGGFYLAGGTTGALPGQTHLGERDAFVVNIS